MSGVRTNNNSSVRGFPEISLDDLINEYFIGEDKEDEIIKTTPGCPSRKGDVINPRTEAGASRRRGKSVRENGGESRETSLAGLRRQRSVSMTRQHFNDSEFHKCNEEVLAESTVEVLSQDLAKIVKDILLEKKPANLTKRRLCSKMRSREKMNMPKFLIDEDEKHIEVFLSNIEDADISSSFDGDRSDTSSTFWENSKFRDPVSYNAIEEIHENQMRPAAVSSVSSDEGILLPWLHMETSNEDSSSPCQNISSLPVDSGGALFHTLPESSKILADTEYIVRELQNDSPRSSEQFPSSSYNSLFFMDELDHHSLNEGIPAARYMQRQRIELGSLILCGRYLL
ncbi:hypothetical protein KSP39_PZI013981 [Platanthera zijinensis]|uniref:Uncharacterized protein n=1 Tax=Platanthera zijinensis TaxID=2320716 RepID=A0AAP0G391_9ASPA